MVRATAVRIHETGGPEVLQLEEVEIGAPGPDEVVARQTAIGLNFIDTYMRTGLYPAKLPLTLGLEGAGIVEDVGDNVVHLKAGDRVAYTGTPGTYASHVKGQGWQMVPLPEHVSEEEGAAVMLKGLTAWMLLFEIRRVLPGDKVLVWAAAGGVGSILVPWAKALGAFVIGVVSTDEKANRVRAAGADEVILSSEDVAARVREITNGEGVDVSLDSVGKDSAEASLASLKPRGLWATYGNASGPVDPIAPARLASGGSLMMTRPTLFHFMSNQKDLSRGSQALFGVLRSGAVSADINQRFALADAADAHRALEGRKTTGSTILIP